jgi:hypothetical protein
MRDGGVEVKEPYIRKRVRCEKRGYAHVDDLGFFER